MPSTTDNAAIIRNTLKSKHGLTNRDVSIKARSFANGSSIDATAKTVKAAKVLGQIKELVKGAERIDRCEYSGEILSGCNCYCNTNIDNSVVDELRPQIAPLFSDLMLMSFRKLEDSNGLTVLFDGDEFIVWMRNGQIEMTKNGASYPHWVGSPTWNDEQLTAAICRVVVALKFSER